MRNVVFLLMIVILASSASAQQQTQSNSSNAETVPVVPIGPSERSTPPQSPATYGGGIIKPVHQYKMIVPNQLVGIQSNVLDAMARAGYANITSQARIDGQGCIEYYGPTTTDFQGRNCTGDSRGANINYSTLRFLKAVYVPQAEFDLIICPKHEVSLRESFFGFGVPNDANAPCGYAK